MTGQGKDRGERAHFDRHSGEVHGSGAGAGGGNPGEDYDADPMGGGGADPVTAPPDERRSGGEGVAGRARR